MENDSRRLYEISKQDISIRVMYAFILRGLEQLKPRKRSKIKLFRALNHYRYVAICILENIIVRYARISHCKLVQSDALSVVCSLTTYPGRIEQCFYAIKTLLLQSCPPNRIVLWLASSQFPDRTLPSSYELLKELGVEIRYCDDLRSHKKYFYALQEQKQNEVIITFDDDIVYHPDTIKRALDMHKKYPNSIVCNDAKEIILNKNNNTLAPYSNWPKTEDGIKVPSIYKYSVMTGSGCLYPYNVVPKQMFCIENIKDIAFTADDIWITFTAKAFGVKVVPTEIVARKYTTISNSQNSHLAKFNCLEGGNDLAISRICELYPEMKKDMLKALI